MRQRFDMENALSAASTSTALERAQCAIVKLVENQVFQAEQFKLLQHHSTQQSLALSRLTSMVESLLQVSASPVSPARKKSRLQTVANEDVDEVSVQLVYPPCEGHSAPTAAASASNNDNLNNLLMKNATRQRVGPNLPDPLKRTVAGLMSELIIQ